MKNLKKILLTGSLALAALFAFNATTGTAQAGHYGFGGYGHFRAPAVQVYHAPVRHVLVYKVFIYDCGVLRCVGTFRDPFVAKQKALLMELNGYNSFVKRIIL